MEKTFKSVALIQHASAGQKKMLLRQKTPAAAWQFVVADRLEGESFRESVSREVAWELRLKSRSGFLVSSMAQLTVEYAETLCDASERLVSVTFVNVHIYREEVLQELNEDPLNRWFSAAEICHGQTPSGAVIDPQVVDWINRWEVIQPWQ